jgi:RNA polymerase sigma factor (sigma-70 family)
MKGGLGMVEMNLSEMLAGMQNGDRDAFAAVYQALKRPVYTICYRITQSRETAEDITHDVFIKLFRSPPDASVKNVRAWIFQMARNLSIDALRKESRRSDWDAPIEIEDPYPHLDLRMDIEAAQRLLNHKGRITNISLNIAEGSDIERIQGEVQSVVGGDFQVVTREEKSASMIEIMELEKFVITLIGCFIALIAAFSIIGSVVMLMTEKRRDIATLRALGCDTALIRRIFVGEGMMLTVTGTAIGLLLGISFCLLQQHFGVIPIEGNMVVDSYPVEIEIYDIITVTIIMVAIGWLISRLTVGATLKRANTER